MEEFSAKVEGLRYLVKVDDARVFQMYLPVFRDINIKLNLDDLSFEELDVFYRLKQQTVD